MSVANVTPYFYILLGLKSKGVIHLQVDLLGKSASPLFHDIETGFAMRIDDKMSKKECFILISPPSGSLT